MRRIAADLCLGVEVIGAPTVREDDGLALSSRNRYLDTDQRLEAVALSRALRAAQVDATRGVEAAVGAARAQLRATHGVDLDYLVPASAPATMTRLRDLATQVYLEFADEHLLALRPPDVIVDLQNWYFTEFERQGRGEEPQPWDGPTSVAPAP